MQLKFSSKCSCVFKGFLWLLRFFLSCCICISHINHFHTLTPVFSWNHERWYAGWFQFFIHLSFSNHDTSLPHLGWNHESWYASWFQLLCINIVCTFRFDAAVLGIFAVDSICLSRDLIRHDALSQSPSPGFCDCAETQCTMTARQSRSIF